MSWLSNYWGASLSNKIVLLISLITFILAASGCVVGFYLFVLKTEDPYLHENGNYLFWDKQRIPLNIRYTKNVDTNIKLLIEDCISDLNTRTYKPLLNPILKKYEDIDTDRIDILFDEFKGSTIKTCIGLMIPFIKKDGEIRYVRIEIAENRTNKEIISTINHELGHALGLAHTIDKNSIMYKESYIRKRTTFTDKDIEKLNIKYK